MSIYSMVFSPTGGTERVMELLEKEFELEKIFDLTRDADCQGMEFSKDDVCLVGVPSYGGRVPQTAVERIRRFHGNGAKAVMVVVYGNRAYEDTMLELKDVLVSCGFEPDAAVAAVAEHSIMRQFAAGRPDEQDGEELKKFAKGIKSHLSKNDEKRDLKVPGKRPYREYHGVPLKPEANKKCVRCGQCASQCPVGAIPEENPMITDKSKCISCMRCVSICPKQVRKLNKVLLLASSQKLKKACSGRKANELFL